MMNICNITTAVKCIEISNLFYIAGPDKYTPTTSDHDAIEMETIHPNNGGKCTSIVDGTLELSPSSREVEIEKIGM